MALAAAQDVDAVAARLVPTVAAGRVYTDRAWPVEQEGLPAWLVFAGDEAVQTIAIDGTVEQHDLLVECRGLVSATVAIDDAMNNLAAAGLTAIHAAAFSFALHTDSIVRAMASDNGAEIASVTVRLRATFFTNASAPETLI